MSKNGQFLNPPTQSNDYVIFDGPLAKASHAKGGPRPKAFLHCHTQKRSRFSIQREHDMILITVLLFLVGEEPQGYQTDVHNRIC